MPYQDPPPAVGRLNAAVIAGVVTGLVGMSYLLERFSSEAANQPFRLLDFLPGTDGQRYWAWLYLVGGVLLLILGLGGYMPRWLRVLIAVFGVGVWGAFGSASAYAALVGPQAADTGSFGPAASLGMVLCLVVVTRQVSLPVDRDR